MKQQGYLHSSAQTLWIPQVETVWIDQQVSVGVGGGALLPVAVNKRSIIPSRPLS